MVLIKVRIALVVFLVVALLGACGDGDITSAAESKYSGATYKLVLRKDKEAEYQTLLDGVGLKLKTPYKYTEYANIKKQHDLGVAGQYDFLLLSTGGNAWDFEALEFFNSAECGWETTYYNNHDLTILHEQCSDRSRTFTTVRVLKAVKGRRPNLHAE